MIKIKPRDINNTQSKRIFKNRLSHNSKTVSAVISLEIPTIKTNLFSFFFFFDVLLAEIKVVEL